MFGKSTRWLAPLAAAAAVLLTAPAAGAVVDRPPGAQDFEFTTPGCDFPVLVTGTGGKITRITFGNGDFFTAGKGVLLTYTNLEDTSKTYTVKTSGSVAKYVTNPDGTVTVTFTGHNGFAFFPVTDVGGPAITQYTGRLVLTLDSLTTFNVVDVEAPAGQTVDVCEALS